MTTLSSATGHLRGALNGLYDFVWAAAAEPEPRAQLVGGELDTVVPTPDRLTTRQLARANAEVTVLEGQLEAARKDLADHDAYKRTLEFRRDGCALLAALAICGMLATNPVFIVVAAPCLWFFWDAFKLAATHEAKRGPLEAKVHELAARQAANDALLRRWIPGEVSPAGGAEPMSPADVAAREPPAGLS